MKYGQHSELVEEIISFVKNSYVLKPSTESFITTIVTINDLLKAQSMAWEETYGKEELSWTDIRETEMSKVKAILYTLPDSNELRKNLSLLINTFNLYLKRSLEEKHKVFIDEIISDLYNCALNRCVNGKAPCFFEQIFEVYRLGGFPCGWSGDYPMGNIVAYIP